ncbi:beta-lactam sensor/signal transducer BlaR1 [Staphylococcus epidermidis]|uniref:beta-lactam sensor/signal transducer BlaR1 n=3 Tax=Staphylococcus epidermidis TaxID=1282 RepID=UPI0007E47485|nr:beta-lactam sensor/signal transducer BlaR1 [Staphylococcus epidermidis]MBM5904465.1 beta-lactam sensor/signal transducer BlaR1 [Staphylococcus epidermidis]MBM5913498.1 beta-lactam sensor/signal transducer BlaR1 [Staphylococcus epidermidis]MBM5918035.1 beta-lactam sensor/signal transducer BlaR1 [Staphylococcus epidermidis]MBM5920337.1 beta-lactam sensor/signal transducer BlaR1 [Staphylococcus epidermidis]MBM5922579.1 beta-lactam sensor/signal transducer BlaR1 [Staphylococcus epidermidis]
MAKLLIMSIVSFCFIFLLLLFFRYILKRYFNYMLNYKVWYLTLLAGLIPFIPIKFSFFKFNNLNNQEPTVESNSHNLNPNINTTKPVHEFTTDIHKFNWDSIDNICTVIWIVLVIILSFKFLNSLLYLKYLKKQSLYLNEKEKDKINKILFNHQYKRNIVIRKAESIHSPITFWYGKYIILIPSLYFKSINDKKLKYIILHEYAHAKNRDTLHLIIFHIFSIAMSYNPLIQIVKRKMIHDNEVEADRFVLNNINKNEFKSYAEAIMDSVLKTSFFNKNILSHSFNGKKSLLKRRLINIKEGNLKKQSKLILIFICIFTFFIMIIQSQFLMGQSLTDYNYKKPLQSDYQILDESKNFGSNSGSFVMYSMKKDKYYIYNEKESRKRYSPDSTYKIYLALFGLDRHIISDKNSRMSWNHNHYPFDSWNKNQDLNTAIQNSVNWYFERISNQLSKNYTSDQLKQLNYGNKNLGSYKAYWLEDSLKISNLEQVIVLKNMMEQNNHFSKNEKKQLSSSLLIRKNENYELYGKTGTGIVNGKYNNGWFVGYVITNHDKYYFSTHLSDEKASGENAKFINEKILKEMGVLNGQ